MPNPQRHAHKQGEEKYTETCQICSRPLALPNRLVGRPMSLKYIPDSSQLTVARLIRFPFSPVARPTPVK